MEGETERGREGERERGREGERRDRDRERQRETERDTTCVIASALASPAMAVTWRLHGSYISHLRDRVRLGLSHHGGYMVVTWAVTTPTCVIASALASASAHGSTRPRSHSQ